MYFLVLNKMTPLHSAFRNRRGSWRSQRHVETSHQTLVLASEQGQALDTPQSREFSPRRLSFQIHNKNLIAKWS